MIVIWKDTYFLGVQRFWWHLVGVPTPTDGVLRAGYSLSDGTKLGLSFAVVGKSDHCPKVILVLVDKLERETIA